MAKPRVILAVDQPGRPFHHIAMQLVRRLGDEFSISIVPADLLRLADCDVAVTFWWRQYQLCRENTNARAVVLGLYDHVSWCDEPQDIFDFREALTKCQMMVVGNQEIVEQLRALHMLRLPTAITEDGVDCEKFKPLPLPAKFIVGWCGDSRARLGAIKGVHLIADACDLAGVDFVASDAALGYPIPWDSMSEWYSQISCYVCASTKEGTPNPPLEAMACGRPVITTRVGIMPRAITHGVSGVFAERDPQSLAAAICYVRDNLQSMASAARVAAEAHDWSVKIPAWRAALHAAAEIARAPKPTPLVRRKPVQPSQKPRFLLIADVVGWAFDVNERDMAEYLPEFDFEFWAIGDRRAPPAMRRYNGVFLPYHRWGLDHYWRGTPVLGSLRSADFDPAQPGIVPDYDAAFVESTAGFHTVTREAFARLREKYPQVVYLTNPVNMRRFAAPTAVSSVIACWNGNAKHESSAMKDVKGYETIVKPACAAAGVGLVVAEYNTTRLPPAEMPAFYRRASVALCASAYEGASNSVMEAMASGLVVIATDVGNHREMRDAQLEHYGDTGIFLVERNVDAFVAKLEEMQSTRRAGWLAEKGALNRQEIVDRWSWDAWRDRYAAFFGMAL